MPARAKNQESGADENGFSCLSGEIGYIKCRPMPEADIPNQERESGRVEKIRYKKGGGRVGGELASRQWARGEGRRVVSSLEQR